MASFLKRAKTIVDQKNPFTDVLEQVETKTGIKKVHQFLALTAIIILCLIVGYAAILYWTYRAQLTNDPSVRVNQK